MWRFASLLLIALFTLGILAGPAQSASREDVHVVVQRLLMSRDTDPGIYEYHKIGRADGAQVWFFRGDKFYSVTYMGSYYIDYKAGDGKGAAKRRIRTRIPLEQRELWVSVGPKDTFPNHCPSDKMVDTGLTGTPSRGESNAFVCDESYDLDTMSNEEIYKTSKTYGARRQAGTLYYPGSGPEFAAFWQESYDKAIKDILEQFRENRPRR